jgi:hypothetical protein
MESQLSEFIIRINDGNSLVAKTMLMRLMDAQMALNSQTHILNQNKYFFKKHNIRGNFNYEILRAAKILDIDFVIEDLNTQRSIRIPRKFNLFSLSQLTAPDRDYLMEW